LDAAFCLPSKISDASITACTNCIQRCRYIKETNTCRVAVADKPPTHPKQKYWFKFFVAASVDADYCLADAGSRYVFADMIAKEWWKYSVAKYMGLEILMGFKWSVETFMLNVDHQKKRQCPVFH
jgi:hypothetical protein